eukprot:5968548-Amphidinium_carterae.1
MLKFAEIGLELKDVVVKGRPDGVAIRSSKTDHCARGVTRLLDCWCGSSRKTLCAACAVKALAAARLSQGARLDDPLFVNPSRG